MIVRIVQLVISYFSLPVFLFRRVSKVLNTVLICSVQAAPKFEVVTVVSVSYFRITRFRKTRRLFVPDVSGLPGRFSLQFLAFDQYSQVRCVDSKVTDFSQLRCQSKAQMCRPLKFTGCEKLATLLVKRPASLEFSA